jgi:hypothetical protein
LIREENEENIVMVGVSSVIFAVEAGRSEGDDDVVPVTRENNAL